MSFCVSCHLVFHVIWLFMSFCVSCHFAFHVICRFMSFGVSCPLAFHVILRFMSFYVSCHFAFHVILRFMSFFVSCHLAFHVILAIIVIIVTKVFMALMLKLLSRTGVCSKSGRCCRCIVIGRYGYKSSFGANNVLLRSAFKRILTLELIIYLNANEEECMQSGLLY